MRCQKCGKENITEAKFCEYCGNKIITNLIEEAKNKNSINETPKNNKNKDINSSKYVIGSLIIVIGLSLITNKEILAGFLLLLTGLSLFPIICEQIHKLISKKIKKITIKNVMIILPIIFSILFFISIPTMNNEELDESTEYSKIEWPTSDVASKIPVPKSNIGRIEYDSSSSLTVYISKTSKKDYDKYVEECKKAGFVVDYTRSDDYYSASDKEGYDLSLMYEENNVMRISIDEPEQQEKPKQQEESKQPSKSKTTQPKKSTNQTSTDNNAEKTYHIGDTVQCENYKLKLVKYKVKKRGTRIDSFTVVDSPEWIALILKVTNTTDNERITFYNSDIELENSNGEILKKSAYYYKIWGYEYLDSPELNPGGYKTGFIQFVNTNTNNKNLKMRLICTHHLFKKNLIYTFSLKK